MIFTEIAFVLLVTNVTKFIRLNIIYKIFRRIFFISKIKFLECLINSTCYEDICNYVILHRNRHPAETKMSTQNTLNIFYQKFVISSENEKYYLNCIIQNEKNYCRCGNQAQGIA